MHAAKTFRALSRNLYISQRMVVKSATQHRMESSLTRKLKATVGASRGQLVEIYHELHGFGEQKVLFITGWAGSCENWKYQTEFFGRHGDYEVCIFENRGSGHSSIPSRNYSMAEMAQDAYDLIQKLGWKNVHVVGVSMGGMIAQEFASRFPNFVNSLTLASTHAGRSSPPLKNIPWLLKSLANIALGLEELSDKVPLMLYSKNWLKAKLPNSKFTNYESIKLFHKSRALDRPPQSIFAAVAQLWGVIRHNVSANRLKALGHRLSSSAIPSLVIHGTEDVLVHIRSAFHLASTLSSRLVIFEGRGHAMNHEDITTFNKILLSHFQAAKPKPCSSNLSVVANPETQLKSIEIIRANRNIDTIQPKDWIKSVPPASQMDVIRALSTVSKDYGFEQKLWSELKDAVAEAEQERVRWMFTKMAVVGVAVLLAAVGAGPAATAGVNADIL